MGWRSTESPAPSVCPKMVRITRERASVGANYRYNDAWTLRGGFSLDKPEALSLPAGWTLAVAVWEGVGWDDAETWLAGSEAYEEGNRERLQETLKRRAELAQRIAKELQGDGPAGHDSSTTTLMRRYMEGRRGAR